MAFDFWKYAHPFFTITGMLAVLTFFLKHGLDLVVLRRAAVHASQIEHERLKVQSSALVAELFASWISKPCDIEKTNRLLFEATLWLPEKEAKELNNLFNHKENAPTARDLIVSCRKLIQGESDSLTANDITIIPQNE